MFYSCNVNFVILLFVILFCQEVRHSKNHFKNFFCQYQPELGPGLVEFLDKLLDHCNSSPPLLFKYKLIYLTAVLTFLFGYKENTIVVLHISCHECGCNLPMTCPILDYEISHIHHIRTAFRFNQINFFFITILRMYSMYRQQKKSIVTYSVFQAKRHVVQIHFVLCREQKNFITSLLSSKK